MELKANIVAKLDLAFQDDDHSYTKGYRDALESFALALQGTIPEGLLVDGLESALDAYANNVEDFDNGDSYDFEDDGQPTEMEEWRDFDPDC
jgi:hypothetical protein